MIVREYMDIDNALFLPSIEWFFIEMTLTPKQMSKYARQGFPTLEIEGLSYTYLPVKINGKSFRIIRGERMVTDEKEVLQWKNSISS